VNNMSNVYDFLSLNNNKKPKTILSTIGFAGSHKSLWAKKPGKNIGKVPIYLLFHYINIYTFLVILSSNDDNTDIQLITPKLKLNKYV